MFPWEVISLAGCCPPTRRAGDRVSGTGSLRSRPEPLARCTVCGYIHEGAQGFLRDANGQHPCLSWIQEDEAIDKTLTVGQDRMD